MSWEIEIINRELKIAKLDKRNEIVKKLLENDEDSKKDAKHNKNKRNAKLEQRKLCIAKIYALE